MSKQQWEASMEGRCCVTEWRFVNAEWSVEVRKDSQQIKLLELVEEEREAELEHVVTRPLHLLHLQHAPAPHTCSASHVPRAISQTLPRKPWSWEALPRAILRGYQDEGHPLVEAGWVKLQRVVWHLQQDTRFNADIHWRHVKVVMADHCRWTRHRWSRVHWGEERVMRTCDDSRQSRCPSRSDTRWERGASLLSATAI